MKFEDGKISRLNVNRLFGINVAAEAHFYSIIEDELGKLGPIKYDNRYGSVITIGTIDFQILLRHTGDDKFDHMTKFKGIKLIKREA